MAGTRSFLLTACGAVALVAVAAPLTAQQDRLTIERIVSQPSLSGTAPSRPAWSPDSRRLAFLWNDRGLPAREIWLVSADGDQPRKITGVAGGEETAVGGVAEFGWTPDGTSLVYLRSGNLWRVRVPATGADARGPERLTSDGAGRSDLAISPDGRFFSFRRDGDLWLYDVAAGQARQATRVGVPPTGTQPLGTYYRPDVEIGSYVWGGPTYTWSPDSRWIAVHYVDRRHVRLTGFPYYLGAETSVNTLRRGYPGDSNEVRRIGFYDVAGGNLRLLDLPRPTEIRIAGFSWSAQNRLLLDRESDTATDRWLDIVDPGTGTVTAAWHDSRPTRVYTDGWSVWHADGQRVLLVGDLDHRYRLYELRPGGGTPKPLTPASYDVTSEPEVTPAGVVFSANSSNPYERQILRLSPDGSGSPSRITTRPGTHVATVSPDGQTVALLSSDDSTPTELYLVSARGGPERRITHSPPPEFARVAWAQARYVTFRSRSDTFTLHARILEPRNLDRSVRHPVVIGPAYSNTVRNRWNGQNGLLQQLLVERGFVVVQVDVRGSTGYGREFREKFLMDWGGGDLEDLQSTVEYLGTLPYVDRSRIGIWGSSYGGTLTVYALLKKPGLFRAGVAAAPATDPRFFGLDDVAITRRPADHPETFQRGAAQYAANLRDHLLIIHGMADDVVPFKTSVDLAEALMKAGKTFDFAFAPAATHGWSQRDYYARYLYGRLVDHFDRYLGEAAAPVP